MSLVSRLLDQLMKSEKYGERRGAAFGLAGVIKGFGISSLKKYGVATVLREGLANRLFLKPSPSIPSAVYILWILLAAR